jgi:hypothetical protein
MCYLGGSWPKEYHGKLFMGNIHGQRLNVDVPERKGSGYVGKHAPDFLNFNDKWSQTLDQRYDQDGNVFIIDWYDKQQCHTGNAAAHDRSNGRIYKIVYGDKKATQVDLGKMSPQQLMNTWVANGNTNAWFHYHGTRLMQERGHTEQMRQGITSALIESGLLFRADKNPPKDPDKYARAVLRNLWMLHSTGGINVATPETSQFGVSLLKHEAEHVRAWTIQLLCEDKQPGAAALAEFARLAKEDPSPVVRLYLASACQRLTVAERLPIVETLLAHAEDATDHNLPLMYWYATEPIVAADPTKGALLLAKAKIPLVREYITRRLTAK